ncbi:hypothetical protein SteCoe_31601 [Stentor coeruleus]|uniref:phosphoinositide 5-phosphatase n=1 Tax=Stentor coeruleus TaxID=5963 RepID=A0A1R2B0X8_9CILI|nr:hypothetical protein SteCoe_31601 [Stentor coeruleus]
MGYPANPTMKLYITREHFILQTPDLGVSYQLIIERSSGKCYCTDNFNPLENGAKRGEIYYLDIFLIVGIVPIDTYLYLVLVTEANIIDALKEQNIYEIKRIHMIPVNNSIKETESQVLEMQNISKLLSSGFYFSYYYDLTRSLDQEKVQGNLHERAEKSFYWNYELYRDFFNQGVDTQWLVPIIQGYVGISTVNFQNETLHLALISRRSCDRTGTRYNCRGLDDDGNVANYVETEQIMIISNCVFSYIQIRGSVPLFWEQIGITAQINVTRSQEMNAIGLKKHAEQMLNKFGRVTMINLLSNSKNEERHLKDAWEEINSYLLQSFNNKIIYQYYDFHAMCKGNRFSNITGFLYSVLQDFIVYYMYYNEIAGQENLRQKGVMRTNCLDCLDRTNVMQSYIGWSVLVQQMEQLQVKIPKSLDAVGQDPLSRAFKNLWADNGDNLSMQYTGTGSTISGVTREGRQGFKGMISHGLKSLGRLYNATYEDAARQKGIDSLLRKRGNAGLTKHLEEALRQRENEFTQKVPYRLRAITWNLAGRKIPPDADFANILCGETPADILIIVFQEVVKLNPRNVLQESNNQSACDNLKRIIERSLYNTGFGYSLLDDNNLVGIALFIYAKKNLIHDITKLETDAIRVGFGGKMGNKGSVAGRFELFDSSICVLGCHLESGNEKNDARLSQLSDINNRAFQQECAGKQNLFHINDHDIKFICGDLNFRVPLNNLTVRNTIKEGRFKSLISSDQLTEALKQKLIPGYQECEINFPPTYKYDFGTNIYDTSKKQRVPSWCDRVLYNGKDVKPIEYGCVDIKLSDHRPVYAEFEIYVKKINEVAKRVVEEEIYSQMGGEDEEDQVESGRYQVEEKKYQPESPKKAQPEFTDLLSL